VAVDNLFLSKRTKKSPKHVVKGNEPFFVLFGFSFPESLRDDVGRRFRCNCHHGALLQENCRESRMQNADRQTIMQFCTFSFLCFILFLSIVFWLFSFLVYSYYYYYYCIIIIIIIIIIIFILYYYICVLHLHSAIHPKSRSVRCVVSSLLLYLFYLYENTI